MEMSSAGRAQVDMAIGNLCPLMSSIVSQEFRSLNGKEGKEQNCCVLSRQLSIFPGESPLLETHPLAVFKLPTHRKKQA